MNLNKAGIFIVLSAFVLAVAAIMVSVSSFRDIGYSVGVGQNEASAATAAAPAAAAKINKNIVVYEGTFPKKSEGPGIIKVVEGNGEDVAYFFEVEESWTNLPGEKSINPTSDISVWTTKTGSSPLPLTGELWRKEDWFYVAREDGQIWINFASGDLPEEPFKRESDKYRIVIEK